MFLFCLILNFTTSLKGVTISVTHRGPNGLKQMFTDFNFSTISLIVNYFICSSLSICQFVTIHISIFVMIRFQGYITQFGNGLGLLELRKLTNKFRIFPLSIRKKHILGNGDRILTLHLLWGEPRIY